MNLHFADGADDEEVIFEASLPSKAKKPRVHKAPAAAARKSVQVIDSDDEEDVQVGGGFPLLFLSHECLLPAS